MPIVLPLVCRRSNITLQGIFVAFLLIIGLQIIVLLLVMLIGEFALFVPQWFSGQPTEEILAMYGECYGKLEPDYGHLSCPVSVMIVAFAAGFA